MNEIIPYNRKIQSYKKELRNNMTDSEKMLWSKIKCRKICGLQFCRQFPVQSYFLDFYCKVIKLNIEIDGPIHNTPQSEKSDANRDQALHMYGIKVLRFTNHDVDNNLKYVIDTIRNTVHQILR